MSKPMQLTGPHKAALMILCLEENMACEILRHFDDKELRDLAKTVDQLGELPLDKLDGVFEEFRKRFEAPVVPASTGNYLRQLASTALGADRVQRVLNPPAVTKSALDSIRAARLNTLAELLEGEHPQIAAVVLSQLPKEKAGEILLMLSPEKQVDLLARVAGLHEIPTAELSTASEAMAAALKAAGGEINPEDQFEFDGIEFTAGLLNSVKPEESERLMGHIEERDAELAPKLREAMFTFEDLKRIAGRPLQTLMREVPSDSLLLALKTASDEMKDHFLGAISSRAAQQIREDLTLMPPTRLSDVERAQKEIVECAMRLAAEGQLVLPVSGGEELV